MALLLSDQRMVVAARAKHPLGMEKTASLATAHRKIGIHQMLDFSLDRAKLLERLGETELAAGDRIVHLSLPVLKATSYS